MILLIGCEAKKQIVVETKYVKQTLPNELLTCKDIGIPSVKTQLDVANYVIELRGGYLECYEKLEAIRRLHAAPFK